MERTSLTSILLAFKKMIQKYPLYDGKTILEYDEKSPKYSVKGKVAYGTTSIIGVLNKPALMYWAVNQSIGLLKENLKPGMCLDEIQIKNLLEEARTAHTKKKVKAGDIGTLIHEWIEEFLKAGLSKKRVPKKPLNKEMKNSIDSFLAWTKKNKVRFLASEQKIYSKKHGYAGTLDAEAMVNGKRTIVDFKTSKALYPEMFLQATAYLTAREEELEKKYTGGIMILRLSKGSEDVDPFEVAKVDRKDIPNLLKVFLSCLEIYKWKMELKRQEILNKNK